MRATRPALAAEIAAPDADNAAPVDWALNDAASCGPTCEPAGERTEFEIGDADTDGTIEPVRTRHERTSPAAVTNIRAEFRPARIGGRAARRGLKKRPGVEVRHIVRMTRPAWPSISTTVF